MNTKSITKLQSMTLAEMTGYMTTNAYAANDPYALKYYIESISNAFTDKFKSNGFKIVSNVSTISRIDPSTDFVGSGISLVKKKVLEGNLSPGLVVDGQKAIRTHTLQNMPLDRPTYRKTTFPCLCAINGYQGLEELSKTTMDFFISTMNIPLSKIYIRINSQHADLNKALYLTDSIEKITVEKNTRKDLYYQHTYGMNTDLLGNPLAGGPILGRNYNICIFNGTHNLAGEVGNVIIMENNEMKRGNEAGFGASTIASHILNKLHTTETHYLATEIVGANKRHHRIRDCLETAIVLIHEGLNPIRTGGRGKKLSDYIRYSRGLSKKIGLELKQLKEILIRTCNFEYNNTDETSRIVDIIMTHLYDTEKFSREKKLNEKYYL